MSGARAFVGAVLSGSRRCDVTDEIFPILAPASAVGENGSWW